MVKKQISNQDNSHNLVQLPLSLPSLLKQLYARLAPEGSQRRAVTYQFVRQFVNHFRISERNYRAWIRRFDQMSVADWRKALQQIDQMEIKPLISILMPVFNPNLGYLETAINSVQDQVYPNWELCLADDASTNEGVRGVIKKFIDEDDRIRVVFRAENGHISAASNSALALARGEYVALLDHDDALHPFALFYVAQTINEHPECGVIYSDEDKLTKTGRRVEPYYKPDFDPDLLLGQNMVSHLGVYQTTLVRDVGGFRLGLEGSQDYDLLLRVIEKINSHKVWHIPQVLYHWRITNQSVATSVDVKPYALEAGQKALQDHLANQGLEARVKKVRNFGYRVQYSLPNPRPSVEVFICARTLTNELVDGIDALMVSTPYQPLKITMCIKESGHSQKAMNSLKRLLDPRFRVEFSLGNLTRGVALNYLVKQSDAEIIGFLDESIHSVSKSWMEELVAFVVRDGFGMVGPQLRYKNGPIYSSGLVLGSNGIANYQFNSSAREAKNAYFGWASLVKGYSALPHYCTLTRRQRFHQVGGFSDVLVEPAAKFVDLCLKMRILGCRNVVVPDVELTLNQNFGVDNDYGSEDIIQNPSDRDYLMQHWGEWINHDPSFNPNLCLHKGKPIVKPPTVANQGISYEM